MNPKWTKWLHKHLFPCCFGRSCLIPNLGYISEAAASVVDRKLFGKDHIVPWTSITSLASPTFHYKKKDRKKFYSNTNTNDPAVNKQLLPKKIGSFQLFMRGYVDAIKFLKEYQTKQQQQQQPPQLEVEAVQGDMQRRFSLKEEQFQKSFEKLVLLDYFIRNTGKGFA